MIFGAGGLPSSRVMEVWLMPPAAKRLRRTLTGVSSDATLNRKIVLLTKREIIKVLPYLTTRISLGSILSTNAKFLMRSPMLKKSSMLTASDMET